MPSQKNMNLLVGLTPVLVALWVLFYAVPDLFSLLFRTTLGNLIMFLLIVIVGNQNIKLALGLGIVFFILFRMAHYFRKEGYEGMRDREKRRREGYK